MKNNLVIFALMLQLATPGVAQQPVIREQQRSPQSETQQQPPPTEDDVVRITTNLVQVDPVITDKNGKIVTDLREDEVEIFEDGKAQKITHFSFVPSEVTRTVAIPKSKATVDKNEPPVPAKRLRPEEVKRTIAIVVDDLGLSHDSMHFVRKALKKFLDQLMEPGDLVAIIRTGAGIGALQQFTSDKRELYAALERVKFNPWTRSIGVFGPPTDPFSANNTDSLGRSDDLDELREDVFTVGTLGAVNYVIRGLRELPGRKSVVLFSGGMTLDRFGAENYRVQRAVERLVDAANRASVVIHTVDATGVPLANFTAADPYMNPARTGAFLSALRSGTFNRQGGLKSLSEATGGLATVNSNDLSDGIRRALDDQKGYYLIGYRPDDSTFEASRGRSRFHHVSLKVKRPGKYKVRLRQGFLGVLEEDRVAGTSTPHDVFMEALTSPFGSAGVSLRLTSLFHNDAKLGSTVRSFLNIKAADLTFVDQPDGWHQSVIDMVAMTFGDNGQVVDGLNHTHTLRLRGEAYEDALKRGVTYTIDVPIKKPGAYQLRTALRDVASNRVGSASQFVEVPDINKKRLTLSGIVVRGVDLSSPPRPSDPNDENANDLTNAALRQYKAGLVIAYGLIIYNAQLDKATGKPQLLTQAKLFRNGQLVFTGRETPFDPGSQTDLKRLENSGAIQLASQMEPGEYVLQIVVTDQLRKDKYRVANHWIDFDIVK